jgi:2-amino-4-hydroxy-6-hydroxymethyldihydropteridine diphosphokinase
MPAPTVACIALGSNLDDPVAQLRQAVAALRQLPRSVVTAVSPAYQNPAIGPGPQPDYVNAVVTLTTTVAPHDLLHALQRIEQQQGRRRDVRWGARTLDLDIVLYGDAIIDTPDLQVPHPRMLERSFVLWPLFDIAPELVLPNGCTLRSRLDSCPMRGLTRLALSLEE